MDDPENQPCDKCGGSLVHGWTRSYREKDGTLFETVCRDCNSVRQLDEYAESGRISTDLALRASVAVSFIDRIPSGETNDSLRRLKPVIGDLGRIKMGVAQVDTCVWRGGMSDVIDASNSRGMHSEKPIDAGEYGPVNVMSYVMCGRVMITLEAKEHSVTVITAEKDATAKMGWQGIDATGAAAVAILDAFVHAWATGNVKMVDDKDVRIAGF